MTKRFHCLRLFFLFGILLGLIGISPVSAQNQPPTSSKPISRQKGLKDAEAKKKPEVNTSDLPAGIQDMLKDLNSQSKTTSSTTERTSPPQAATTPKHSLTTPSTTERTPPPHAATPKRSLSNEDFGAPPADEMRAMLSKKAEEQGVTNEKEFKQKLESSRSEIDQLRKQRSNTELKPADRAKIDQDLRAAEERYNEMIRNGKDKGYKDALNTKPAAVTPEATPAPAKPSAAPAAENAAPLNSVEEANRKAKELVEKASNPQSSPTTDGSSQPQSTTSNPPPQP